MMTSDLWRPHAHAVNVDLAAAYLAKSNRAILEHLRDAADNLTRAIDVVLSEIDGTDE